MKVRALDASGAADLASYYRPGGFFFERDGDGVVAGGVALAIDVAPSGDQVRAAAERVTAALAGIDGDVPIALGSLPFDGSRSAARLVVPEWAIVRRGGRTTLLLAGEAEPPRPLRAAPHAAGGVRIDDPSRDAYVRAVAGARAMIQRGTLGKVVLARSVEAIFERPVDPAAIVSSLREADPGSYTFAVSPDAGVTWAGASPELLVARDGRSVRSEPLAGSVKRGATGAEDAAAAQSLLASAKDRAEHGFVARAVADALRPVCAAIDVEAAPSLMGTSRVWHLRTRVHGTLHRPPPGALALAALLHPTPAVCGTPRDAARDAIASLESMDREIYSGIVGWMDGSGDGEWAIALRCARIAGSSARLYAGSGIVAASDPQAELEETDAKLDVLRHALRA